MCKGRLRFDGAIFVHTPLQERERIYTFRMATSIKNSLPAMLTFLEVVSANDLILGKATKLSCHTSSKLRRNGILHRAFSLFEVDLDSRMMLIQQRSESKLTFPGLWTNSLCSHTKPGENFETTIRGKFAQEWGEELTNEPRLLGKLQYSAVSPSTGLVENELDYVYVCSINSSIRSHQNAKEICSHRIAKYDVILQEVQLSPELFTPWFIKILKSGLLEKVLVGQPSSA